MQRRSVLLAVGASLAAPAIALAQSPAAPTPAPRPADGAMPQGAMGQAAMGQAEMTHLDRTMKLGTASLMQARVGVEKANVARVKMFAQLEVAEQETIGEVLRMMHRGADAPKPSDAEMAAMLDADAKQAIERLRGASDDAFERQFVEAQIAGHRQLLDAQEDYIRVGRNREHLGVAKLARGHIKEHLEDLDMLQKELRRA